MSEQRRWAPVILRIAGLPAETMDALSSPCCRLLDSISQLESEIGDARLALVDKLYAAIHGAPPEKRHGLLAVKRDCFNGRSLARHATRPAWQFVEEAAGPLSRRVLELEQRIERVQREFTALFDSETDRQYRHIAAVAQDPAVACGLSIASPQAASRALRRPSPSGRGCERSERVREGMVDSADATILPSPGSLSLATLSQRERDVPRADKRLMTTLLRYVSRASLKLSPFSTFTAVGLAQFKSGDDSLQLQGRGRQLRSLVRLRRHILDRCTDLLALYPPWRNDLTVAVNDSVINIDDGRVLLRRPGHYRVDGEGKLRFQEESLVRLRVDARLRQWLRAFCAAQMPYVQLVSLLVAEFATDGPVTEIEKEIGRLLDAGYLHLLTPWSSDEPHLEKALLHELRALPRTSALESVIRPLEQLIHLEAGFAETQDPPSAVHEMQELVNELLQAVANLCGTAIEAGVSNPERDIYHDVWCTPASSESEILLTASQRSIETALESVAPLVRYSTLYDHRTDFLCTLGAYLRERKPERRELPLLEAFECAQPLWQSFMKFQVRGRDTKDHWRTTWNPAGLPVLDQLAICRNLVDEQLESCLIDGPEGRRVIGETLDDLLRKAPARFTENHAGACLFLQPASADGSLWILNRLKEGTARFASRYTPLMTDAMRYRLGADLSRNGCIEVDGEEAQLLDIHCVQGDTLNVHAPLTAKILALPGTHLDLAPERLLKISDLVLSLTEDAWPSIRDRRGRRYLPVHLGVCYHDYLPTLVKFLCAFGPGEMGAVFPPPLIHEESGIKIQQRTIIGNVVLHRTTWRVPIAELRAALDVPLASDKFARLHAWRRKRNIPERVFAVERVAHPILGFRYQPQYVNFTSPIFLPILQAIAATQSDAVDFSEMLPEPAAFPKDADGRTWAVELLVDSRFACNPEERCVLPNGANRKVDYSKGGRNDEPTEHEGYERTRH